MPRLLALEWDQHEARVAVATVRDGRTTIDEVFAVDLAPRAAGAGGDVAADIGARLAAALTSREIGRAETLVAVGRANIELKVLSVPPAPAEETPDLVRFQALREFNALDDDWPLDYLPLSQSESGPQMVLAAAISPEIVEGITETCQASDLQPSHIVLRACATASLLKRQAAAPSDEHVCLLVDMLVEEADLTVLLDNEVVLIRTVRLPDRATASGVSPVLLSEVRRTMAAVQNQLGGRRVEAIHLCGSADEHAELAARLEQTLSLPVHRFDPFDGLATGRKLRDGRPPFAGRYAPLLGMLLDEAANRPHDIDFLHTRRAPQPQNYRRPLILAGAAVVLFVAAVAWWIQSSLAALDDDIAARAKSSLEMDALVKKSKQIQADVQEIDAWATSDIVWLDELAELSREFPPAEDAMVLDLRIVSTQAGGRVDLEGLARDVDVIDTVEQAQRDDRHRVETTGSRQSDSGGRYGWRFDAAIHVERAPDSADNTEPTNE